MTMTYSLRSMLLMVTQLLMCTAPTCTALKARQRPWVRAALAIAAMVALEIARTPFKIWALSDQGNSFAVLFNFSLVLVELFLAIRFVFDGTPWQALFCCSTAYAGQNLMSGASSLMQQLAHLVPGLEFMGDFALRTVVSIAIIYVPYLLLFVRETRRLELARINDPEMMVAGLVTLLTVIGIDIGIKSTPFTADNLDSLLLMRLGHATACVFAIYAECHLLKGHRLAAERAVERRMAAERERQYQLTQHNMDAINAKCHDLRHQIRHLGRDGAVVDQQVLNDLAHEVDVFDALFDTGNEALDTVLTEKSLACERLGITLAVIADGHALDFLPPADTYALFGNALENAMEATAQVADPEERAISLMVERKNDMTSITLENRCEHAPDFVDGLPRSTKGDALNHGFGMRSMRAIAERYEGALTCGWEDGTFWLNVLLVSPA